MSFWTILQNDWHKIVVVLLVLAHGWKYFFEYIRPTIHKDTKTMTLSLPKEGCVITVQPLDEIITKRP